MTAGTSSAGAPPPELAELLRLFRRHPNLTRANVMALTGLSRSTVNQRMDALIDARLLVPAGSAESTGGRPPSRFAFHAGGRCVLVAHIGASGVRAALCNLAGQVAGERACKIDVADGPTVVLDHVARFFQDLLTAPAEPTAALGGIGISVPGPVQFATGRVVSPPIMTGWDGYDIPGHFARYGVPVLVENDVNAMALGEQRTCYPQARDLLMIKVSTGIGAGIIHDGHIMRGAQGSAGDIGHIPITTPDGNTAPVCRCGKHGCAEAYASGWALIRDLQAEQREVESTVDLVPLIRGGDPAATELAHRASTIIGGLVAGAVNLLNPSHVIIGGTLARADEVLLAGIRQAVYARSTPLATKSLYIGPSQLDTHAGITGLAHLCADHALGVDDSSTRNPAAP